MSLMIDEAYLRWAAKYRIAQTLIVSFEVSFFMPMSIGYDPYNFQR